jgi:hypothetical protein
MICVWPIALVAGNLQLWHIDIFDSPTFTSAYTLFATIAGFRIPDHCMAMPKYINLAKHLLWTDFYAVPAGITATSFQADEIVFPLT